MHFPFLVGLLVFAQPAAAVGACDEFHWVERFARLEDWTRRPEWLPNGSARAAVVREGGAACFRVDEPGQGMKWSRAVPPIALAEQPYLVLRYRAENLDVGRGDSRSPRLPLHDVRGSDRLACRRDHTYCVDRVRPRGGEFERDCRCRPPAASISFRR